MIPRKIRTVRFIRVLAVLSAAAIVPADTLALAQSVQPANAQAASGDVSRIPPDQLDSLVAPIALYPDPLLAQTLAASTYPLELMQLQQWLTKNPGLKDKALADAVSRESWDSSIQAMAALPDVVKRLTDDIQWTTDLGNAFLAQEGDVMDAIQRMRQKAQNTGALSSTPQQTVETEVVENKQVIVIEQADPQVLYVPSYNPVAVYGEPVYPYPSIYYPPYYSSPGWTAAGRAISWGAGVAMGAAWGGGWGWRTGWGHNDITINHNNFFNRNANINGAYRGNLSNTWQHRPEHRGGAPYRDRATAQRYGGTARGDSLASRQASARQQVSQRGGNLRSNAAGTSGLANRAGAAGVSDRMAGTAGRGNRAGASDRMANTGNLGNRAGGAGVSDRMVGSGNLGNRTGGAGVGDRSVGTSGLGSRAGSAGITSRPGGGGADRVGSRDLSRSTGAGYSSAFSGGSQRFNGSSARASSARGSSSFQRGGGGQFGGGGSRGGGGGFRGGGGRGGGGRGSGGRGGGRGGGRR
jgi:hypothetical protein